MINIDERQFIPLKNYISEYKELNSTGEFAPVAVGRYGIRTRESIYSKELAKDYSKNKLIFKDTLTVGMGSVQIDIGILTDDVTYSVSPAYHTYRISGIDSDYLRYCLQCRNKDMFLRYVKRGSRQGKSIDLKRWLTYEIPVYSDVQQNEIVKNLKISEKIIEKRKLQLKYLDDLISGRFVELFGEPLSNKNGWQTMSIVEAAPIKSQHGDLADEVWLLNLDAVEAQTGTVLFKNRVQSGEINASTVYFTTDNVLYSKLRPYLNKVVMPDEDGVATSEMIPLYPMADKLKRAYLCYWLRSDAFVRHISEKVSGAKMPRVSMDYFRSLAIELPLLGLQEQFADFVKVVDKSKLCGGNYERRMLDLQSSIGIS